MKIDKNNPILIRAISSVIDHDVSLNKIEEGLSKASDRQAVSTLGMLHFYRTQKLSQIFDLNYLTTDDFYYLNFKNLPFDIAVDLNIEMVTYLCNKEIDQRCLLEIERIKLPILKWYEAIYANPDNSWQEINRKFGMTPIMPLEI